VLTNADFVGGLWVTGNLGTSLSEAALAACAAGASRLSEMVK
jgi:hypothetical protein